MNLDRRRMGTGTGTGKRAETRAAAGKRARAAAEIAAMAWIATTLACALGVGCAGEVEPGEDGPADGAQADAAVDVTRARPRPGTPPGTPRTGAETPGEAAATLVRPSRGDPRQAGLIERLRPAPWLDPTRTREPGVQPRVDAARPAPSPKARRHPRGRSYHLAWIRMGVLHESADGTRRWVRATFRPNPRAGADDYWRLVETNVEPAPASP